VIGRAIAEEFVSEGASVSITGRDQGRLDAAAAGIDGRAVTTQGDVTAIADIDAFVAHPVEDLGPIDILVANAGSTPFAPAETIDEATFDAVSDVNFEGKFFTVQRAPPHLADGASVIFITSAVNVKGFANPSVYSAAKAAGRSLVRTLAAELAPRGIRVNAMSPGAIEMPFFEAAGTAPEQMQGMVTEFIKLIPLGRFGRADEVARAARVLASDDSSCMTGSELSVDGGVAQV